MTAYREIVITSLGVVSPIGIGPDAFWNALSTGRSGVRRLEQFAAIPHRAPIAGEVADFEPKKHVRVRKSLKVMSRDIQLGFAAADQACQSQNVNERPFDPERTGVVYGADMIPLDLEELESTCRACIVDGQFRYELWGQLAMKELYPLWMLKYLPNMSACHIGIALDLRGPNNSLLLKEVSSLAAFCEAARVIERGQADVMITGGTSSRLQAMSWVHEQGLQYSQRGDDPATACRPFDRGRDGQVNGEGAAAFVLQTRESAQARGDRPLARLRGFAETFEPVLGENVIQGAAIRRAIRLALERAGLQPADVGHVNAHGLSNVWDDQVEAQAIRAELGDTPVTAFKSYFGNLAAAGGAVEMAASLLALRKGLIPPTLNYQDPDPACPINVVHGAALPSNNPIALLLNHSQHGRAVAVVIEKEE